MRSQQAVLRDVDFVKQAIGSAREFAEGKGVAMTLERLAVCLGIGRKQILNYIGRDESLLKKAEKESQALLKLAYEEIAASQAEHGMMKGNHSTMDVLLLKNNHNYGEKTETGAEPDTVVFFGEENIPE